MTNRTDVYFSFDVEADGPIPGEFSMSSLGMVACAVRERGAPLRRLDIDAAENCFYTTLEPISARFDPAAAAVADISRTELVTHGQDPAQALPALASWIDDCAARHGGSPVAVAFPLGFDWLFLYWYLIHYAGRSPFAHGRHLDIRTLYVARTGALARDSRKSDMPRSLLSGRPHTHNALDDAREQAELFCSTWDLGQDGTGLPAAGQPRG